MPNFACKHFFLLLASIFLLFFVWSNTHDAFICFDDCSFRWYLNIFVSVIATNTNYDGLLNLLSKWVPDTLNRRGAAGGKCEQKHQPNIMCVNMKLWKNVPHINIKYILIAGHFRVREHQPQQRQHQKQPTVMERHNKIEYIYVEFKWVSASLTTCTLFGKCFFVAHSSYLGRCCCFILFLFFFLFSFLSRSKIGIKYLWRAS